MSSGLNTAEQGAGAKIVADAGRAPDQLHTLTLQTLEEFKALDVVSIDLRGKSPLNDFMVIATGTSSRHVSTLAEKLVEAVKHTGGVVPRLEGLEHGDWVLLDAGDVIVHVFRPEVREFYNLERMWMGELAAPTASPTPS